jgi:hypothetical protein
VPAPLGGVTMRTVPEMPHKASSIMLFPDVRTRLLVPLPFPWGN